MLAGSSKANACSHGLRGQLRNASELSGRPVRVCAGGRFRGLAAVTTLRNVTIQH